jgi:adenylate cyclase
MAKSAKEKNLEKALDFKNKLTEIINIIHDARDINDIIINTRAKILDLLDAERITIYAVDARSQQVYSLFKEGDGIKEIRVPRSNKSLVGYVALTG